MYQCKLQFWPNVYSIWSILGVVLFFYLLGQSLTTLSLELHCRPMYTITFDLLEIVVSKYVAVGATTNLEEEAVKCVSNNKSSTDREDAN